MASTVRIPIINAFTLPDSSSTVYFEPAANNLNTTHVFNHFVVAFTSQAARQGFAGKFTIPKDFSSTATIVPLWATTATSGAVVWDFDYSSIADGESGDPGALTEATTVTDTAAGTARLINGASISLTSANLSADDELTFNFYRNGASGADTLAATSWLYNLYFQYLTV